MMPEIVARHIKHKKGGGYESPLALLRSALIATAHQLFSALRLFGIRVVIGVVRIRVGWLDASRVCVAVIVCHNADV